MSEEGSGRLLSFMEVCGTHTMAVRRHGLHTLLPRGVRLLSGPGCPVCVTPVGFIDHALALSEQHGVILATFGDLIRVPGSRSSLERQRARGARVEVVYSPLDALALARKHPDVEVVFLGVGFETTAPAVASSMLTARKERLPNYTVLCAHKLIPPAMMALVSSDELRLDGFLCPGHVSAIIGAEAYQPLADRGLPCVITGFEPEDIKEGIRMLVKQTGEGRADVEIQYRRVVRPHGNVKARTVMDQVFTAVDTIWRGLSVIPGSGLRPRDDFSEYDAGSRFSVRLDPPQEPKGCICGEILKGLRSPEDCPLFGSGCTPSEPVGACMVSSEGTCAAYYHYRDLPEV